MINVTPFIVSLLESMGVEIADLKTIESVKEKLRKMADRIDGLFEKDGVWYVLDEETLGRVTAEFLHPIEYDDIDREVEEKVKPLIKKHEGLRLMPYRDKYGNLTIGYGRNLSDKGISANEAEFMLENDVKIAIADAKKIVGDKWEELPLNVKLVLVDMSFNLGLSRLKKFKRFIRAIRKGDWKTAKKEMLDSLWAEQVGNRAKELAEMIEKC